MHYQYFTLLCLWLTMLVFRVMALSLWHCIINCHDHDQVCNSSLGLDPPSQPRTRFDIIRWDYFTNDYIFFDNDFSNGKPLQGTLCDSPLNMDLNNSSKCESEFRLLHYTSLSARHSYRSCDTLIYLTDSQSCIKHFFSEFVCCFCLRSFFYSVFLKVNFM